SGLLFVVAGCSGGSSPSAPPLPPSPVRVSVSPSLATVSVGTTAQFTATVSYSTNQAVTWQVNGSNGGNASVGTISGSGLYTAPLAVPLPATVTVAAISQADTSKSASAAVSVTIIIAASISGIVAGTLQTFMSTKLQPADTSRASFFTRTPDAKALLDTLGS